MATSERLAITIDDVIAAAERLDGVVNRTPILTSRTLNELTGHEVFIKCESFQRTGAFKFRGAFNAINLLAPEVRAPGVVAYSSGNHAQGVALAARLHNVPAVIVMPTDAPVVNQDATRGYGAEIVFFDRQSDDPETLQYQIAEERGMTVIHAYDSPHIIAGQGTATLELMHDVPDLDAIITPVGGGGLLAGCCVTARRLSESIRVFGAETIGADDTKLSLDKGERVTIPTPSTIADGIRLRTPGDLTWPIMRDVLEDVLVVTDDDLRETLRFVLLRMKIVIEPSGAVPIAALLRGLLPADCHRVGVIVSGGNVAPELLAGLWSGAS